MTLGSSSNRPADVFTARSFVRPIAALSWVSNVVVQVSGSAGQSWQSVTLGGATAFSGSNYAAGREITVLVTGGASDHNTTFDANWKWVGGAAPANLAAGKKAKLTIQSWGSTAADVVAEWRAEP